MTTIILNWLIYYIYFISAKKWSGCLDKIAESNPVKCPNNCQRKFGGPQRKYQLKNHLVNECGLIVKCPVCPKQFGHVKSLRYHMGAKHKIIY